MVQPWLLGVCRTMSIQMPRLGVPEVSSSHWIQPRVGQFQHSSLSNIVLQFQSTSSSSSLIHPVLMFQTSSLLHPVPNYVFESLAKFPSGAFSSHPSTCNAGSSGLAPFLQGLIFIRISLLQGLIFTAHLNCHYAFEPYCFLYFKCIFCEYFFEMLF